MVFWVSTNMGNSGSKVTPNEERKPSPKRQRRRSHPKEEEKKEESKENEQPLSIEDMPAKCSNCKVNFFFYSRQ